MAYVFIALTLLLTAYGQLVLKWQTGVHAHLMATPLVPANIISLLLKPWVITAFVAAFGASICWMAAISRMPVSKAYPFMVINLPLVAILAVFLFQEQMDHYKIAGTAIIMIGVIVLSRSPV